MLKKLSWLLIFLAIQHCLIAQVDQYWLLKSDTVGGPGGFDYLYADSEGRNLYIPRIGNPGSISVFNLDTLEKVGQVPNTSAHGVAISSKSNHGFASSKPVVMFDSKNFTILKTINVEGSPDGILYDLFTDRIYIFSHKAPTVSVINANDGSIAGTIDLEGAPEQAVSDSQGNIYVDIEDKDAVSVINATTMKVENTYSLYGKGGICAGLALDIQNQILFVACRNPHTMVIMDAKNGRIIDTLPIGEGTDGATFNPNTMEAFSSQSDGTLTVIKENSPTDFIVEQTVQTQKYAKTLTLDILTNRIFLITAEFGAATSTQIQGRYPNRGPMLPDTFTIIEVGR
jgi:DNA-binding beta-propeller fold protein YncE